MTLKFRALPRLGAYFSMVLSQSRSITKESFDNYRQIFILCDVFDIVDWSKHFKKDHKNFARMFRMQIKELNKHLKALNSLIREMGVQERISTIDSSKIEAETSEFFNLKLYDRFDDKVRMHLLNSFGVYVRNKFRPVEEQLVKILKPEWDKIKSFHVDKIKKIYRKKALEVVDLHMLGYHSAALLVVARIFEEIFQKYFLLLSSMGKIEIVKQDIKIMKFENMLGYLKSKKYLSEKDWLLLSKLREDRNVGAHFSSKQAQDELVREAESTIKLSLGLINKYAEKIEKRKI